VNITNSPGYDNQPSFAPDGGAIFFTSVRGGGTQTDIYRYDLASAAITRVTSTPESEYSPTVTPDGAHLSVIRVEADGAAQLHDRRPLAGAGAGGPQAGRLPRG
jgi:Tol biopolymer transport system component